MNSVNGKEIDFVVYEPVRRSETNLRDVSDQLPQTKKFSGLYNRGNTCYLNSLIQILFLTPEFRNNILSWKYIESIHGKKEDCIPFQLQKLFARMKLRCRDSETTEGLTKSFQWDHQQLLEQHDIQELCRVLFEAIEMSLSELEGNFIIDLFQGSSISVVKCLKCLKESVKKDHFMDVSLPIRNEFEKIYNTSLEMAFKNFLKEEKLSGSEQYFCEQCVEKVDALKYLKFTKLPKILFLQMNRFEYDIYTEGRKKICDRVTYPMILNMNPFLKDYSTLKQELSQEKLKTFEKREGLLNSSVENEEEWLLKFSQMSEEYIKEGEFVYELYAVVVHSGSARSGHYYSYIKSYDDNKWYRFEDSSVYEASLKSIESTFGENNHSGATGYILMYKQIMPITINLNSDILLPDFKIEDNKELFELIEKENILLKEEEEKQKEKLNSMLVKFIYDDRIANIVIKRSNFLNDLKAKVMKEFKLNGKIDPNNVRIRSINTQTFKMQEPHEDESKTLEELRIVPVRTYTLEIKNEDESFEEFDPDIIYLNICLWNFDYIDLEEKNLKFEKVKVNSKIILKEFKELIYKYFSIDSDKEIILFKKVDYASNNYTINYIFEKEEDLLKEFEKLNLTENSKLYLEIKHQSDNNIQSQFVKYFENNCANVMVKFNFPVNMEVDLNASQNLKSIKSKKVCRITFNSYKFDNQIEIKSSKTLKDLKSKISEVLNIPQEKLIIKKNTHNGVELKNLQDTIDKYTTSSINVYVEYGNQQKDSEIKINLYTCEYDFSTFMIYPYKLVDQGLFIVDLNWTVDELKQNLLNELKKKNIEGFNPKENEKIQIEEFLIREYKNERPAKIYQNHLSLGKDLRFAENIKLILQKYIESKIEFINSANSFQVSVREWDPSNWIVHTPIEIHLSKGMTFVEIASVLSTLYPHIEIHNISATKIGNEFNIYMDDIRKLKFDNLYENCDYVIDKFPFFISSDGFMLIVKDGSKQSRDPTEEEIRSLCRPKLSNSKMKNGSNKNGTNGVHSLGVVNHSNGNSESKLSTGTVKKTSAITKNKIKEKGVVIKVKKNEVNKIVNDNLNGRNINENTSNEFEKNGEEETEVDCKGLSNGINDDKEFLHHEHNNGNGSLDKNGKNNKNFVIEIQTKNFNHENKSKVDLSEYDEIFINSHSNTIKQDKEYNK